MGWADSAPGNRALSALIPWTLLALPISCWLAYRLYTVGLQALHRWLTGSWPCRFQGVAAGRQAGADSPLFPSDGESPSCSSPLTPGPLFSDCPRRAPLIRVCCRLPLLAPPARPPPPPQGLLAAAARPPGHPQPQREPCSSGMMRDLILDYVSSIDDSIYVFVIFKSFNVWRISFCIKVRSWYCAFILKHNNFFKKNTGATPLSLRK